MYVVRIAKHKWNIFNLFKTFSIIFDWFKHKSINMINVNNFISIASPPLPPESNYLKRKKNEILHGLCSVFSDFFDHSQYHKLITGNSTPGTWHLRNFTAGIVLLTHMMKRLYELHLLWPAILDFRKLCFLTLYTIQCLPHIMTIRHGLPVTFYVPASSFFLPMFFPYTLNS